MQQLCCFSEMITGLAALSSALSRPDTCVSACVYTALRHSTMRVRCVGVSQGVSRQFGLSSPFCRRSVFIQAKLD